MRSGLEHRLRSLAFAGEKMRTSTLRTIVLNLVVFSAGVSSFGHQDPASSAVPQTKSGHSSHEVAFDDGPRQKPWVIQGIGESHFPITTHSADVQFWFNQGNTLLHSYWFYEAERAFRWCLKLDPECAMCYWGLARASGHDRMVALLREAAKRKDGITSREKMYIEAWEQRWREDGDLAPEAEARFERALQEICLRYPDDPEAKLLFAQERLGSKDSYGIDAILQQVIAAAPRHPGALHYRIHLWDRNEPEYVLADSVLYGSIATGVGHGQHMVGHIYAGLGMWHEAAIHMDAANRIELRYMREHMIFPFNDWNYAHNRDFLSYVQEQLGMVGPAIQGARELLAFPLDPKYNPAKDPAKIHWEGLEALMRVLIRFERWEAILDQRSLPWGATIRDEMYKTYCETLAWIGLGNIDKAARGFSQHGQLKQQIARPENKDLPETYAAQSAELLARFTLAKGDALNGLALLSDAAKHDLEYRRRIDPFDRGSVLYNILGEAYLAYGSPRLAASAFKKTLEVVRNDGFALAGLVEAYGASGQTTEARNALARLLFVWSDAETDLKWLERAKRWKLDVQPIDASPSAQRRYRMVALQGFGPERWEPFPSPTLDALDSNGRRVTLQAFRGKNVLLVFHPPGECPLCLMQIAELGKRQTDFSKLGTDIVEISGNTAEEIAALKKANKLQIQMFRDPNFEDAHRFQSYDEFDDLSLNSTLLIDKHGNVDWSHQGGDPFLDFDFLLEEVQRMNEKFERTAPSEGNIPSQ